MKKLFYILVILGSLYSCKSINREDKCPTLRYNQNDNLIYLKDDSSLIKVIVEYTIHAIGHDTINGGKLSCRYRVYWVDTNNINHTEMIYDNEVK